MCIYIFVFVLSLAEMKSFDIFTASIFLSADVIYSLLSLLSLSRTCSGERNVVNSSASFVCAWRNREGEKKKRRKENERAGQRDAGESKKGTWDGRMQEKKERKSKSRFDLSPKSFSLVNKSRVFFSISCLWTLGIALSPFCLGVIQFAKRQAHNNQAEWQNTDGELIVCWSVSAYGVFMDVLFVYECWSVEY